MTPGGAHQGLQRELRRLQHQLNVKFRQNKPLSTAWLSENGSSDVVGWGKLLVRHITKKREFLKLVDLKKNEIRIYRSSDAALRGDLQYPNRVKLDLVVSVKLIA